jgi:hypothetical protein
LYTFILQENKLQKSIFEGFDIKDRTEKKTKIAERKKEIQDEFWNKMKLNVDKPRFGGSGNSTTENVCRKAFSDPLLLSTVLGLDFDLVQNFSTLLIAMSCQLPLNLESFAALALSTANIWVDKYSSFKMTPSVHKVLIHGVEIMRNSILPVGILSEEAAEAKNKICRRDRLDHALKNSRKNNLEDVFYRSMDSSDPFLSSLRIAARVKCHKKKSLPLEVTKLLLLDNFHDEDEDETSIGVEMQKFYDNLDEIDS